MSEDAEEASYRRYGLRPSGSDLDEIRAVLRRETARRVDGHVPLMTISCVQLFNAGQLDDVLTIWAAKESSFDAHCSIDVQLLCGAGLAPTRAHLAAIDSDAARHALAYLGDCETAGDFDGFTVEERARWYDTYYAG